eukprot:3354358-Pyramimonas_sp.AAC.1
MPVSGGVTGPARGTMTAPSPATTPVKPPARARLAVGSRSCSGESPPPAWSMTTSPLRSFRRVYGAKGPRW